MREIEAKGFEPLTCGARIRRSTKLSYASLRQRGSNSRHADSKSAALPTELCLTEDERFERSHVVTRDSRFPSEPVTTPAIFHFLHRDGRKVEESNSCGCRRPPLSRRVPCHSGNLPYQRERGSNPRTLLHVSPGFKPGALPLSHPSKLPEAGLEPAELLLLKQATLPFVHPGAARGGIRTHTLLSSRQPLRLECLPFHHSCVMPSAGIEPVTSRVRTACST